MKKLVSVLLATVILTMLLAACSGGGSSSAAGSTGGAGASAASTGAAPSGDATELTIAMWGDEARAAAYQETLAPFCEANNCTVNIELIPIGDFFDKLASQLGAGTAPDIFWLADAKEGTFIKGDWCLDLSETLNADPAYKLDDFYEDAIYSTDYDGSGSIYGVPFSFGARPIFYNKTLFEEAGVKTPAECVADGTWTYETMFDLAAQITAWDATKIGLKLWCVGQNTNGVQMFADLLPAYGTNLVNADSTEFTLDNEAGVSVIQMVYDSMYTNGGHAKPGDDTAFVSGNIAMARETYSYMTSLADGSIEFEYDLVPQPEGPEGTSAPLYTGYAYWCANATGKNTDLAARMIQFLTTPENQLAWCKTFMSPRESVMNSDEITNLGEGYPAPETIKSAFVDPVSVHGLYTYRGTSDWTLFQTSVQQNYEMIWAGALSVEEGLAQMKIDCEPYLNK